MAKKGETKKEADASGQAGKGGAGGNGNVIEKKYGVKRIMLWPSRKINLGNYNSVELNAGIEIEFENTVAPDSQEVKDALSEARAVIRDEWKEQYKPYAKAEESGK